MERAVVITRGRARFDDLYAAHAPDARRVAYLLVGNRQTAEDITQDAFIRVLGRFGNLRKPEAFRSYLMRTVVSLTKNHHRRRSLERAHTQTVPTEAPAPSERDDDLLDALRKLPERQRVALVLRYCEDLSEKDAADIMQTTPKAVKSLVTRGLAAMREEVGR
jgi:RNA polymerase sigma factor (sigma-70 family)